MGIAGRFGTIPGSAFEVALGTGYDVALLPNFLHHFDFATNVTLLKRVRVALKPGGLVAVVEFVPNEDRVSPPEEPYSPCGCSAPHLPAMRTPLPKLTACFTTLGSPSVKLADSPPRISS